MVIAALYVIVWLAGYFAPVIIPIAIALLLSALMAPGVDRLAKWRRAARARVRDSSWSPASRCWAG